MKRYIYQIVFYLFFVNQIFNVIDFNNSRLFDNEGEF